MNSSSLISAYLSLSFLCGILNIPPTLLHLSQGHSGPAAFGIWVVVLNILAFVNGAIWRNDALDRAPAFCDISSKIGEVGPLGLLIANCCIIRYLAQILTPSRFIEDSQQKRRRASLDYILSFGFPTLIASVSVVYQVSRYQVNKLVGCSTASALVWPTFILSIVWPIIYCGVSCGYCCYVLYCLVQRHRDLQKIVNCAGTALNVSRFVRMGALSAIYLCVATPCTIYGTLETIIATGPYVPWASWSTVHNEDNKLSMVRQDPLYQYQLRDWLPIVAGLMSISFFSFGAESVAMYTKAGLSCLNRVGKLKEKIWSSACLPTQVPRRQHNLRGILDHNTSSGEDKHTNRYPLSISGSSINTPAKRELDPFRIQVSVVENSQDVDY